MRRLDVSDYTVPVRNDQGIPRFKVSICECSLNLEKADPTNIKVTSPDEVSGDCPKCGKHYDLAIPEYLNVPYHMKDSVVELLMSRQLEISGKELLERDVLGKRILASTNGCVLLEEEDWARLVQSAERVKGLTRADVTLVRRIFDAEKVEVEIKQQSDKEAGDEVH